MVSDRLFMAWAVMGYAAVSLASFAAIGSRPLLTMRSTCVPTRF
jgi:hypothetical protein